MVSEDSDQIVPGLLAIHRLERFLRCPTKTLVGRDATPASISSTQRANFSKSRCFDESHADAPSKNGMIVSIKILSSSHHVAIQVLPVVVVSPIRDDASHSKEVHELVQTRHALRALRHGELVRHLIAGFVASAARPVRLPNKADGEATLSVYKTNNPAELNQSFLLISCTRHIVTVPPTWDGTRSAGFSDVPAYGQMRTARLPVRGAAIYLRTVPDCYYSSTSLERSAHF